MNLNPDSPNPQIFYMPSLSQSEQLLRTQLHKEIKSFRKYGVLFPVHNPKLTFLEHYICYSTQPSKRVTQPLFDRLQNLTTKQKQLLSPYSDDTIIISEITRKHTSAWLGDTITNRRKYDQWYWKMRLTRTPFNQAVKLITNPLMTRLQRRAHDFHLEAAIQRNSHLTGPPKWLIIQSIDWD
jgi:hypothetical protein